MTRAKISQYSATANDNTDVNGIDIAEGCPPSSMNNMGREIMAALKRFQVGSDGDGVTVGGSLVVSGSTSVNTFNVDVISEKTSATGVTVDGVLLKDSGVVTGAGTVSAPVYSTTGDLNTGIFFPAADTIAFAEGGAEAMRITSAGRVAIGSTDAEPFGRGYATTLGISSSANAALEVNSATGNAAFVELGINGTRQLVISTDGSVPAIGTNPSLPLAFNTNATERARIDSSGNLLVGTTSLYGGEKLATVQSTNNRGIVHQQTNASNTSTAFLIDCSRNTTNGTYYAIQYFNSGAGANKFVVLDSGDVQNTNNSYGSISDAKLKENVTNATPKLEKLNQVRVVNFNLIGQEKKQIGVVAQELEQIFPGMVEESPDRDAEGNDLGTTTKSVKYSVFVPMLIKAIQELKAINDAQASRIETLEAKVAALENA